MAGMQRPWCLVSSVQPPSPPLKSRACASGAYSLVTADALGTATSDASTHAAPNVFTLHVVLTWTSFLNVIPSVGRDQAFLPDFVDIRADSCLDHHSRGFPAGIRSRTRVASITSTGGSPVVSRN